MDPAVIAARETAARLIQRAYRYYRVRHHFQNIVQLARARKGAAPRGKGPMRRVAAGAELTSFLTALRVRCHDTAKPLLQRGRSSMLSLGPSRSSDSQTMASPLARTPSIAVGSTDREMLACIYEFNHKPEKGIAMLIEHGLIEDNEEAVAEFLAKEKRLNKAKVGEYLGAGYADQRRKRAGGLPNDR